MRFPSQDLTNQYVSQSFEPLVQYYNNGSIFYLLDGTGSVLLSVPSASWGGQIITADQTISHSISSSYAVSASYALNAGSGGGGGLATGSTYPITSSQAVSASYALSASYARSSSWSLTASYVSGAFSVTASYANFAGTASYAITASDLIGWNFTGSITPAQGNTVVLSYSTGSFEAAFFDYSVRSGSNARYGTLLGGWGTGTVIYTEYCSPDVGNSGDATMSMVVSTSYVQLVTNANNTWTVRAVGRYL